MPEKSRKTVTDAGILWQVFDPSVIGRRYK